MKSAHLRDVGIEVCACEIDITDLMQRGRDLRSVAADVENGIGLIDSVVEEFDRQQHVPALHEIADLDAAHHA
jgi:hypothetical protein